MARLDIESLKKRWPKLCGHAIFVRPTAIAVYVYSSELTDPVIESCLMKRGNGRFNFEEIAEAVHRRMIELGLASYIHYRKTNSEVYTFWLVDPNEAKRDELHTGIRTAL